MRVYIAGPYAKGDVAMNIREVIEAADMVLDIGHTPYVPHLTHLWHLISPHPQEEWLALDGEWLKVCDVVLRIPGESVGANSEVLLAMELGIPVVFSEAELERWLASHT